MQSTNTSQKLLPLTLNKSFIQDFMEFKPPCFAIGLVEENNKKTGFLIMRPDKPIPSNIANQGFAFGHCLYGNSDITTIQFSFKFYDFKTYDVLVNPNNYMVKTVLNIMTENKDYFFFVLNPDNKAITFRSVMETENLAGLKDNMPKIMGANTTDDEYNKISEAFKKNSASRENILNWVCRNNIYYLDLSEDRIEINPC
jgi:hypothetical protein